MLTFPVTSELLLFLLVISIPLIGFHLLYKFRHGIVRFISHSIARKISSSIAIPRKFIATDISVNPPLTSSDPKELAFKFKFTLAMLFLNIYTYIFTSDFNGTISQSVLENLGFSYQNFAQHQWFILVTSNFIHFNLLHLTINMVMLLFVTGALELLMGSAFTAIIFLVSMNSNIPNGIFLLPLLRVFFPVLWLDTVHYIDVGASLGIIGTLGGLARLLIPRLRWSLMGLAILGAVIGSIYIKTLFGLDHAFAAILGYLTAVYLIRISKKKVDRID